MRIDGKDYIFGQNYGWLGLSSMLHEPVVSEEGRLLTVQWDINSYSVIQKIALSVDPTATPQEMWAYPIRLSITVQKQEM